MYVQIKLPTQRKIFLCTYPYYTNALYMYILESLLETFIVTCNDFPAVDHILIVFIVANHVM